MSEPDSTASQRAADDGPAGPIAPTGPADTPAVVRAETPSKGKPVIELLPGGKPVIPVRPETGTGEKRSVLQRKSSPVIARSSRVRELPPPPKIVEELGPDDLPTDSDDLPSEARDILTALAEVEEEPPPAPIELADLQIKPPRRLLRWRRRVIRVPSRWQRWVAAPQRRKRVGYCVSGFCHLALLLILALAISRVQSEPEGGEIHARSLEDMAVEGPPADGPLVQQIPGAAGLVVRRNQPTEQGSALDADPKPAQPGIAASRPIEGPHAVPAAQSPAGTAKPEVPPPAVTPDTKPPSPPEAVASNDKKVVGKLNRRLPGGRSEGVRYGGGTPQSEEAVERGLRWLVAHQRTDGSWHFNHMTEACLHYCTDPGNEASTTAATALALLPMLGAGYTHKEGEYQDVIQRGLDYLRTHGVAISYGNDLRDGSIYGQGLATIVLCEAYGLTRDPALLEPAQGGVKFILWAQDPKGGGWRYTPGEPGDTTVTGWMLMALRSAQMAGIEVPSPSIHGTEQFLSSVQNTDGSQYGYMTRQPRKTTTAVGLLCRMYTGWHRDNPALIKGIAHLSTWGPSRDDIYYDYYATQVLFHWAGPEWNVWNNKMRDMLISTQDRNGHAAGSWSFGGKHGAAGGRLYSTSAAIMILEVYYRYMPLYSESAVDGKY